MQVFARSIMARVTLAVVSLWLGAGSAWAGGGGADVASLQNMLNKACSVTGVVPCPQLPTVSQVVLEIAALKAAPPDLVRFEGGFSPTDVLATVNPPSAAEVVPLAFIPGTTATVTESGDTNAHSFFYAAADQLSGQLNLVYDYTGTNPNFAKGQTVAQLSLPLVISNSDGSQTEAPTTITILGATGCGKTTPCVSATASSPSFGTVDPAKLGVIVSVTLGASANSGTPHAIVSVQAKLLVTSTHDPAYFVADPVFVLGTPPFFGGGGDPGFASKVLASPGVAIGIAPYAGPLCSATGTCPPASSSYPYCATIAGQHAVAAFLSLGKFGETYASAPRQPLSSQFSGVTCTF